LIGPSARAEHSSGAEYVPAGASAPTTGRFLQGNNKLEHRTMIERAIGLFEEMNATGWINEARLALAAA
jgi:hypothetical protein